MNASNTNRIEAFSDGVFPIAITLPSADRKTILQFGSAVAAKRVGRTGPASMSAGFRLLMGFHVLYSQVLLDAARRRVMNGANGK